jgi:division protein CdvB (Snf7/Vps24/ESCRT-III family)
MAKSKILAKLEDHDKRFDDHDKRFENISLKLIRHGERLDTIEENMMTRKDKDDIMTVLDGVAKTMSKVGVEVTVINHRTKKMEDWIIKSARINNIPYGT